MGCSVRRDGMLKDEISSGVSDRIEFFAGMPDDPSDYCKTAEAFTNTFGGKIIFGIGHDGDIRGIDGYTDRFTVKVHSDILVSSGNDVNPCVYKHSIDGKWVIVADIPRSMNRPIDRFGGLIRSGGSNIKMSAASRRDLEEESEFRIDPKSAFMSSIECARIRGSMITDRRSFLGRPTDILRPAVLFVSDHINITNVDGEDRFEVPLLSIREFIINALKHRSYNHDGPILISIYDDRIDIVSPGMMAFGITAADAVDGCKRCRNSDLAQSMDSDDCIGLSKAIALCSDHGLMRPEIVQEKESVRVTVHRTVSLPDDGSAALMAFFRKNPKASIADAAVELGKSVAITRNIIEDLRNKGMLIREGSKKFGTWRIIP